MEEPQANENFLFVSNSRNDLNGKKKNTAKKLVETKTF